VQALLASWEFESFLKLAQEYAAEAEEEEEEEEEGEGDVREEQPGRSEGETEWKGSKGPPNDNGGKGEGK
jgi:hypothetical protein